MAISRRCSQHQRLLSRRSAPCARASRGRSTSASSCGAHSPEPPVPSLRALERSSPPTRRISCASCASMSPRSAGSCAITLPSSFLWRTFVRSGGGSTSASAATRRAKTLCSSTWTTSRRRYLSTISRPGTRIPTRSWGAFPTTALSRETGEPQSCWCSLQRRTRAPRASAR